MRSLERAVSYFDISDDLIDGAPTSRHHRADIRSTVRRRRQRDQKRHLSLDLRLAICMFLVAARTAAIFAKTVRPSPAFRAPPSSSTASSSSSAASARGSSLPLGMSLVDGTTSSAPPGSGGNTSSGRRRLVLVGGGHAHVQVLRALNSASRPPNMDVTLVDVSATPSYSGMVPGAVAGLYRPDETLVRLGPLARWAEIDFVEGRVVDIDVDARKILVDGVGEAAAAADGRGGQEEEEATGRRWEVPFDVISIDIGSASRGVKQIPGVREYSIPTRPISDLVRRVDDETEELLRKRQSSEREEPPLHVVVVGGGPAGIELSMSIMGRWKPIVGAGRIRVTLLDAGDELLPNETAMNRAALVARLTERGVRILHGVKVDRVEKDCLRLGSGELLSYTHCLWATGAASHPLASSLRERGLAVSDQGWIRVNECLQSVSHPHVFAAGDCCTMDVPSGPPPKAGVYAVRAGPVLIENLTCFLMGGDGDASNGEPATPPALKPYHPQDDFLKLMVCGDGTALGFRFGIPIYGKWVFELKDAIDRSFMALFAEENLPKLVDGQPYDTSQYDAGGERPPPMEPKEAATLLQRTDDGVDYEQGWNILRDMAQNEPYRDAVLGHIKVDAANLILT